MLGKLIKYDMRAIKKLLLPMSLFLAIATFLGCIAIVMLSMFSSTEKTIGVVINVSCGSMLALSILAIIAFTIISFFVIVRNFYKSMYTDEGYLTHTLPVTTHQLILSKLFAAFIWSLYFQIIAIICGGLLVLTAFLANEGSWEMIYQGILYPLFTQYINFEIISNAIMVIISIIVSEIFSLLTIYLAITIGAIITNKNKVLAAIGFYFIINIITSIISTIFSLILMAIIGVAFDSEMLQFFLTNLTACIISAAMCVATYFICNHLIKNKLNLP